MRGPASPRNYSRAPRVGRRPMWRLATLADEIAKLKAQDGKPIIAHGGASFARSLIAADLVDQYVLLVHPIALGKGLPMFSDVAMPRRSQADELENLSGWRGSADLSAGVSGSCSRSGVDCPPAVQTMIFWRCIRRASCVTRQKASAGDRVVEDDIHRLRGIAQQLARFFIPILGSRFRPLVQQ